MAEEEESILAGILLLRGVGEEPKLRHKDGRQER